MIDQAESLKSKAQSLNEVDGPVFKVRHDPRFTRIGELLSHTAVDEIPQLINVMQGIMSFVGPRPLPINEANKVPKKYQERFSVFSGMTSPWILKGAHTLSFRKWMQLDCQYVRERSIAKDIQIIIQTLRLVLRFIHDTLYEVYTEKTTKWKKSG